MWNIFVYKNESFLIKTVNISSSYNIILTDFVNVWTEELPSENIIERCKELNTTFKTDNDTYIKTVLSLIEHSLNENDIDLIKTENGIDLECKTKLLNATFKFQFHFKLSNNSTFCKEITVPMIQTVQLLEQQQKLLCDLLVKKDKEIYQHEFENGSIKRGDLITEKFDPNTVTQNTSQNLCQDIFNKSDEFHKILIEKYGCPEPKLLQVKKEETVVKHKSDLAKRILKYKKPKLSTKE